MNEKRRSFWRAGWTAVLAGLCLFAACGPGGGQNGSGSAEGEAADEGKSGLTILSLGEKSYTNDDFRAYVNFAVAEDPQNLPPEALSRLFDKFLDEKILLAAGLRRNIGLSDEEKKEYLAKRSLDSASDTPSGIPAGGLPEGIFDRLIVEKYVSGILKDFDVSRAEIREYYNEHKRDFLMAERVQVSQILYDTEQKAVAALRRLEKASPADFHEAAREESLGPEAVRGGLMGIYKPGDLPEDMERVIFSLPEGRLSRVVESAYGFHIFRVEKKLPPHLQTAEEAAPAIRLKVLEDKYRSAVAAHIEELKNEIEWDVHYENLIFPYQRLDG